MVPLTRRYAERMHAVLSCLDRVVITGTLPDVCHAGAMAAYLTVRGVRLFDFPQWANQRRHELRRHAERLAATNGLFRGHVNSRVWRVWGLPSTSEWRAGAGWCPAATSR